MIAVVCFTLIICYRGRRNNERDLSNNGNVVELNDMGNVIAVSRKRRSLPMVHKIEDRSKRAASI